MFTNLNIESYNITKLSGIDPLTGVNPSPVNKISKKLNISFQRKENIKITNDNKIILVQGDQKNEHPHPPEKPKPSISAITSTKTNNVINRKVLKNSMLNPPLLQEVTEMISNGLKQLDSNRKIAQANEIDAFNKSNESCNELIKTTVDLSRLEVYKASFTRFIEDFKIYGAILTTIKNEYDNVISSMIEDYKIVPSLRSHILISEEKFEFDINNLKEENRLKIDILLEENELLKINNIEVNNKMKKMKDEIELIQQASVKLKKDYEEVQGTCVNLTKSLSRLDLENKKTLLKDSVRQMENSNLRISAQKSQDEVDRLRHLLHEMETLQSSMVSHEIVEQQAEEIKDLHLEKFKVTSSHKHLINRYSVIKSIIDTSYKNYNPSNSTFSNSPIEKTRGRLTNPIGAINENSPSINSNDVHITNTNESNESHQAKSDQIRSDYERRRIRTRGDSEWIESNVDETMNSLFEKGFNPRIIIENFLDEISELKSIINKQKNTDISNGYNEGYGYSLDDDDDDDDDDDVSYDFKSPWSHFEGLGYSTNVPAYLRWNGFIQNLLFSKSETINIIKDIWQKKQILDSKAENAVISNFILDNDVSIKTEKISFPVFFEQYVEEKCKKHNRMVEFSYNLMNALKKYQTESNCKLLLLILNGELSEEVWYDRNIMIHMVKSECLKAENEKKKKNIDNDRYLSTDQFFKLMKTLFPTKLEVSFARLQKILVLETKSTRHVIVSELFSEDENGNKGQFFELLCHQHIQEIQLYLDHIFECIENFKGNGEAETTVSRIREAICFADTNKPRTEVNLYLAYGCNVNITTLLLMEAKRALVNIDDFKKRLKLKLLKKSPIFDKEIM